MSKGANLSNSASLTNSPSLGGRPKREIVVVRIVLSLHPDEDDDLIDFFVSLPKGGRSRAVITALRTGNIADVLADEGLDDDQMADALSGWLR